MPIEEDASVTQLSDLIKNLPDRWQIALGYKAWKRPKRVVNGAGKRYCSIPDVLKMHPDGLTIAEIMKYSHYGYDQCTRLIREFKRNKNVKWKWEGRIGTKTAKKRFYWVSN